MNVAKTVEATFTDRHTERHFCRPYIEHNAVDETLPVTETFINSNTMLFPAFIHLTFICNTMINE